MVVADSARPALGKGSFAAFMKAALEIVWILTWVCAGLVLVGAVAIAVAVATGTLPIDLTRLSGLSPLTVEGRGRLGLLIAAVVLALVVGFVGTLIVIHRLRLMFRSIVSGNPFNRDNANHLRTIWITLVVVELSRYAIWAMVMVGVAVFGSPENMDVHVRLPVNLTTWGVIGIIVVLAEVFREGARLKEEQELTI